MAKSKAKAATGTGRKTSSTLSNAPLIGTVAAAAKRHPKTAVAVSVGATAAAALASAALIKQQRETISKKKKSSKSVSD